MSGWERLLRAGAAVVGGFQLAADHLHDRTPSEPVTSLVREPCPLCPGSLADGPHFHGLDAVWPTDERDVVLLTDLDGGTPLVIPTVPPEARP